MQTLKDAQHAAARAQKHGVALFAKDAELPSGTALRVLKETMATYKRAFDALRPPASVWSEVGCSVVFATKSRRRKCYTDAL